MKATRDPKAIDDGLLGSITDTLTGRSHAAQFLTAAAAAVSGAADEEP